MKRGFTSYSNNHLTCPCLSDELYRLKIVLEAHMGTSGSCIVMIKTLAKEMNKTPRTISRELKLFTKLTNLQMKRRGKIYEFTTTHDTSVLYGKTPVSHIMPHECPVIKRISQKELAKNLGDFSSKGEMLSPEAEVLLEKIVEWNCREAFNTKHSPSTVRLMVRNSIRKYGYEIINRIWEDTAVNAYSPHPRHFWKAIQAVKEGMK